MTHYPVPVISNPNSTMSTTHEHDLPSLTDLYPISKAKDCSTQLSFCLPTSLAFAKRLTWEQTPWIPLSLNTNPVNPISQADAHTISDYLFSHLGLEVRPEVIQKALFFGTTYQCPTTTTTPDDDKNNDNDDDEDTIGNNEPEIGPYPHLFVIFPDTSTVPSHDTTFLRIWHDDIVKPAFDQAWRDSGLTRVHGAALDSQLRLLPPTGTYTEHDARPAAGFLHRKRNGNLTAVRTYWPCWTDSTFYTGTEGKYSCVRSAVYSQAWTAITGMLNEHPQLLAYQNPILLALCRSQIHVSERLGTRDRFRAVAQEWDGLVDARFVRPASFAVVFEVLVGVEDDGERVLRKALNKDASARVKRRVGGKRGEVDESEKRGRKCQRLRRYRRGEIAISSS
jgi:hypothetical protein